MTEFLDRLEAHDIAADIYLPVEFEGRLPVGDFRVASAQTLVDVLEEMKEELAVEEDEEYEDDEDEEEDERGRGRGHRHRGPAAQHLAPGERRLRRVAGQERPAAPARLTAARPPAGLVLALVVASRFGMLLGLALWLGLAGALLLMLPAIERQLPPDQAAPPEPRPDSPRRLAPDRRGGAGADRPGRAGADRPGRAAHQHRALPVAA